MRIGERDLERTKCGYAQTASSDCVSEDGDSPGAGLHQASIKTATHDLGGALFEESRRHSISQTAKLRPEAA